MCGQQGFGEPLYLKFVVHDERGCSLFSTQGVGDRTNTAASFPMRSSAHRSARNHRRVRTHLVDATHAKVVEGDAIDSAGWTCPDSETHGVSRKRGHTEPAAELWTAMS